MFTVTISLRDDNVSPPLKKKIREIENQNKKIREIANQNKFFREIENHFTYLTTITDGI